jgi:hypothetical protein
MIVSLWWGALMYRPVSTMFLRHPLVSRWLTIPPVPPPPCCYSVVIRTLLAVFVSLGGLSPCFPRPSSFSASLPYGKLPQQWPGFPQLQHADHLWSLRLVGDDCLPQNVLALGLWCLESKSTACSSRACLRSPFTVSFPSGSSWILMARSCTPSANDLPASILIWYSGSAR